MFVKEWFCGKGNLLRIEGYTNFRNLHTNKFFISWISLETSERFIHIAVFGFHLRIILDKLYTSCFKAVSAMDNQMRFAKTAIINEIAKKERWEVKEFKLPRHLKQEDFFGLPLMDNKNEYQKND